MNAFEQRIVEDLAAFAPDLLERGLESGEGSELPFSVSGPIWRGELLARQMPILLAEIDSLDGERLSHDVPTARPRGAVLSRRACDYAKRGARVLPRRWVRRVPDPIKHPAALRYLLHLIERRSADLTPVLLRRQKWFEEAMRARVGDSVWAQRELSALEEMGRALERVVLSLDRARASVLAVLGPRARSSARIPRPFPRGSAWASIRRLEAPADAVLGVESLRGILNLPIRTADMSFLFQRWCGVHLLQALRSLEFKVDQGDPVGAILLGGHVVLKRGPVRLDLWVEPRLHRSVEHPSGFRCAGQGQREVTPDYLLVSAGPHGPDAFVLDATKSGDDGLICSKFRYMTTIESASPRLIAGVPTSLRPAQVWAMAAIGGACCRLYSGDGRLGVIPMHAGQYRETGLRAWVQGVVEHATAWARRD